MARLAQWTERFIEDRHNHHTPGLPPPCNSGKGFYQGNKTLRTELLSLPRPQARPTPLEQFDGSDFEGVALYFARDVDTQVIFLVGCLERCGHFAVASGVEFDELLVAGEDAITACLAL